MRKALKILALSSLIYKTLVDAQQQAKALKATKKRGELYEVSNRIRHIRA